MVKGSCLCGGIEFELNGELSLVANCHCSMCRKAHAAAFGTYLVVKRSQLKWVKGDDLVEAFESSPGNHRCFCRICGSSVPNTSAEQEEISVAAGLLDDDPGARPQAHIFVGSKAPWYEITDAQPQFDEWPPGYGPSEGS